jgi:hypothetical protein
MLFFYQDLMIKNLKFKLILYISHMIFLPTKLCYGVFVILLKILTKFPSLKKARELGLYLWDAVQYEASLVQNNGPTSIWFFG